VSYVAIRSRINRNRHDATAEAIDRVVDMLSEVRGADPKRLQALEDEADEILESSLRRRAEDMIDEERFRFLSLALDHVRRAIDRRREMPSQARLKTARN
jgi:hypothetical protein